MSEERVIAPQDAGDDTADPGLRPRTLDDFVGQRQVRENLSVFVEAARARRGPGSCAVLRTAGAGQDDAGAHRRQ